MRYPLNSKATSLAFGATPYPINITNPDGTNFGYRHHGHDDPKSEGTPVYATEKMTINYAGSAGSAGNMVRGEVSNRVWRFLHLSTIIVSPGRTVQEGQLIGYTGNTGFTTGPHLHFDVAINGKYSDPIKLIEENQMATPSRDFVRQQYKGMLGYYPNETQVKNWQRKTHEQISKGIFESQARVNVLTQQAKDKAQCEKTKQQLNDTSLKLVRAERDLKRAEERIQALENELANQPDEPAEVEVTTDQNVNVTIGLTDRLLNFIKSIFNRGE